jgi:hypothetical protein
VNPYLQVKVDEYNRLKKAVDDTRETLTRERREPTPDEMRSVVDHATQAETLYTEIEQLQAEQLRHAKVEALQARIGQALGDDQGVGIHPAPGPANDLGLLPPLLPDRDQAAQLRTAIREGRSERFTVAPRQADIQTRATITMTNTGTPVGSLNRNLIEPRRLAVAARIPVTTVLGGSNVTYPVFGAGSAEITAEGVLKQEYAAVTAATSAPQMINVWTDYTRQVDLSMPDFERRLRSKLASLVAIREDKLLIATALALTLPTFAKTAGVARSDALLQAAGTILAATGAQPNVAVVNTADMPGIFTGSAGAGGETPEEELRLQVRGMTVYPSADIASGTALVGAWPVGSSLVVGLPPTYLVDAVSGIKNNKITVLLEEAVQLAVDDLGAFVKITTFTN